VSGPRSHRTSAERGFYYVLGKHALAWVEIYFDGLGSVPFDPTPGRGLG
jgi:hypothetical protein